MRREEDWFGDEELVIVYMARRLREALSVERALDEDGLDYAVMTTPYTSGILFRSERAAACFYVRPGSDAEARDSLRRHGFKPYEHQ